ncbi:MAG: hypothetical protein R3308_08030, partial [Thiohalobacterales bacterium]|nr:hypothetical protein [Thiohalobacterales bacterium]
MSEHDHLAAQYITRLMRMGVMTALLLMWLAPAAAERITPDRETLGETHQDQCPAQHLGLLGNRSNRSA